MITAILLGGPAHRKKYAIDVQTLYIPIEVVKNKPRNAYKELGKVNDLWIGQRVEYDTIKYHYRANIDGKILFYVIENKDLTDYEKTVEIILNQFLKSEK